jgi:chromosome partitioning protein
MARTIIVANQKGGVGKTTTIVNLASFIAEAGKSTLVVDLDSQGNSCSGLGIQSGKNETSLYEVLLGLASIEEIVKPTQIVNLSIVPSNINLSGAQVEMVELEQREHRLSAALDPLRDRYEYIFIDSPPSLGLLTINGLVAADSVIIPIQCEYYALEGLSQLLKTIELVRSRLNRRLVLEGVLLTMYDTRTNLSRQVVDEILAYFKNKVYKTIIPRNVRLAEAPSYGQPISIYDSKSIGAVSYFKLSREVMRNGEKSAG